MNKLEKILKQNPVVLQLLRFAAIGGINTALDFAVFNFLSVKYEILAGVKLGSINVIGFSLAVIQSYFWNKYWAFGKQEVSLVKNVIRLSLIGLLGCGVLFMVLWGRASGMGDNYFLGAIFVMILGQLVIWYTQRIKNEKSNDGQALQFAGFIAVSIVGLFINSIVVAGVSYYVLLFGFMSGSEDLIGSVAKLLATVASLVWNFIGYKLIVFKK